MLKEWTRSGTLQSPSPTSSLNGSIAVCKSGTFPVTRPTLVLKSLAPPGKYFYVWLDAPIGYMASFKISARAVLI